MRAEGALYRVVIAEVTEIKTSAGPSEKSLHWLDVKIAPMETMSNFKIHDIVQVPACRARPLAHLGPDPDTRH